MPRVRTRAGQVSYTDSGSGPPVVLLHATLHDHHDFDAIAPALRERHRVIAVDWPGHGESDAPELPHIASGTLFADVLEDLVTTLDLPSAAFIGNSVGGYAASRLAITKPERVRALVLVNAAGFTPNNLVTRAFCRAMGTPAINRRLLPRLVPRYMKPASDLDMAITERAVARAKTVDGVEVAASLWRSFADPDYDLRRRAAEHTAPTLFVWVVRDVVFPLRAGKSARRALPQARLETFETGHVAFASDPRGFLGLVTPFLAKAFVAHASPVTVIDA
jgi:pimeloyl-ACP methyl ester carboxylesterase